MGDYDERGLDHLASLAEKKRLWWRNGIINGAFIVSWCVLGLYTSAYTI
jgi:solute carrier family 35, member C2